MRYLDIETWNRKKHFQMFLQMDYPHFNICANIDITNLRSFLGRNKLSFFKAMVCLASKSANDIEEFRYRIRDEKVVVHDRVDPSFTHLTAPDVFSYCAVRYQPDLVRLFREIEKRMSELQGQVCLDDEGRDDLLYITSIPWVSFTSISHPIHLDPVDSIPRIAWGKFFEENGKIKLPFSVQVHHALMDGLHVGRYFQEIQDLAANPEAVFHLNPATES